MQRGLDRILRWLLPTLGGLLFLLAYAFTLFIRSGSLFAGDGDPGRHIRLGRYILEHAAIPRIDLFSHTMQGQPFIPFEWLSEVIFAAADIWGGLAGVAILTGLLFAGTVWLTYVAIRRAGIPAPLAFAFGVLALLLQAIHLHPRPHMFTTLLAAVFSLMLLEVRRGASRNYLLVLPILMALWVNLHGGFLVGFILLVMFTAEAFFNMSRDSASSEIRDRARWLTATLIACFVVSLANPAGWEIWPHTTGYLRESYLVNFTQEYKSPNFHDTLVKSFLVAILSATMVLGLLRTRIEFMGLAIWCVFGGFALHSTRNIPLFAVTCMPWLAIWTDALLRQTEPASVRIRGFARWSERLEGTVASLPGWPIAAAASIALTVAGLNRGTAGEFGFDPHVFPVRAVAELRAAGFVPPGPVYNEFIWGGYLLYAWPDIPVFIDGQTDFYGEELTREYRALRFLQPGWEQILRKWEIRWVLMPPEAPLVQALARDAEWGVAYRDSTTAVLVKR